jgi:hypothetical protein
MTQPEFVDDKVSGGNLNLLSIKDILKIENEQFIQFYPISDENANEYFDVIFVVEALANYLY